MVDWNTNEAGTVHRAEAAIRCPRFLRLAEIKDYSDYALLTVWNVTDMNAHINEGLRVVSYFVNDCRFISVEHAKIYAEREYLQP